MQIHTLYKPLLILFIIHVTVIGFLKNYAVVQKQNTSVTKVGVAHAYQGFYKHTINEVLLYNKSKQTRNKKI